MHKRAGNFTIEGRIKAQLTVTLDNLNTYKSVSLDSMTIFNHLMQRKSSIKNIKGVLLKDILAKVEIDTASPKILSEYYLVFTATDNYNWSTRGTKFLIHIQEIN